MASPADQGPPDPFNMVLLIFQFLGMGSLMPWNYFLTVNTYWMFKLRNVTQDSSLDLNLDVDLTVTDLTSNVTVPTTVSTVSNSTDAAPLNALQLKWNSYLSIFSMIPNVTFLLLNAAVGHRFPTQPRLLVALVLIIAMFVFSDVMAAIDTDHMQDTFLYLTLATVVVINVMVAIFQGGLSGVAAKFPPRYMGAVLQGQALGGTFCAATAIVCVALGAPSSHLGFYCFLISIIFISATLVAFIVVTRTEFFKFYFKNGSSASAQTEGQDDNLIDNRDNTNNVSSNGHAANNDDDGSVPNTVTLPQKINVLQIAGQIIVWIMAVFITFFVTLAVFPAITSLVVSTQKTEFMTTYFSLIFTFLLFNVGDYVGRLLAGWILWPKATKLGGWIALLGAILRISFIPLFVLCNASPQNRTNTQVVFNSDVAYVVFMALFSISNGYLGSICMIFAPKMLPDSNSQSTAASIMVAFLVLGLAIGSFLSSFCLYML